MSELLKSLRQEQGWSQEQLADIAGLSVRTIQRAEAGEGCALETAKALAAAFDVTADLFLSPRKENGDDETPETETTADHLRRIHTQRTVRRHFRFYRHLFVYVVINAMLAVINLTTNPDYLWFLYPLVVWGLFIAAHALKGLSPDFEERAVAPAARPPRPRLTVPRVSSRETRKELNFFAKRGLGRALPVGHNGGESFLPARTNRSWIPWFRKPKSSACSPPKTRLPPPSPI